MKYVVSVNGESRDVTLDGGHAEVNGTRLAAQILDLDGTPEKLVTIGSEVHRVVVRRGDARGRYIHFAKSTFPEHLRLDGLKVVLDCANGAAYHVAPEALWELGAEVVPLGVSPDGLNINDKCGSTHPQSLQELAPSSPQYQGLKRHLILTAVSHQFLAKVHQDLRGEKPGVDGVPGANGGVGVGEELVALGPLWCSAA